MTIEIQRPQDFTNTPDAQSVPATWSNMQAEGYLVLVRGGGGDHGGGGGGGGGERGGGGGHNGGERGGGDVHNGGGRGGHGGFGGVDGGDDQNGGFDGGSSNPGGEWPVPGRREFMGVCHKLEIKEEHKPGKHLSEQQLNQICNKLWLKYLKHQLQTKATNRQSST